jgi:hypothetical protein
LISFNIFCRHVFETFGTAVYEKPQVFLTGVGPMPLLASWRDVLGGMSVALAILAFVIYGWQTLVGKIRPHPLSWILFGILSVTGYWIQRDQGARAGSWVLLAMTAICFFLAVLSIAKGERTFPLVEWAFLAVGCLVLFVYLSTHDALTAALLVTVVDALGFGPTFTRGWSHPQKDSVTSFALNGAKFVPSLLAMDPASVATWQALGRMARELRREIE